MNTDDDAIQIQIKLESETEGNEAHRERPSALSQAAEFIKPDLFTKSTYDLENEFPRPHLLDN